MKVIQVSNSVLYEETGQYLENQRLPDKIFDMVRPENDVEQDLLCSIVNQQIHIFLKYFSQRVVGQPSFPEMSWDGFATFSFMVEINGTYHKQDKKVIVDSKGFVYPQGLSWKETATARTIKLDSWT